MIDPVQGAGPATSKRSGGGPWTSKRRLAVCGVILALLAACGVGIKYGRHSVFAKRFAVVEPGRLYRSGYLEPWPLKRVIHEHRIATILTLMADEPGTPRQEREESIARREGVRIIRIGMPGNGCSDFDLLDQAADVMADESNRPLLVHCAAGVNRTGAVYAAWRTKHRGWDLEPALAEGDRFGYSIRSNRELCDHLRRYYDSRIVPARLGSRPPP